MMGQGTTNAWREGVSRRINWYFLALVLGELWLFLFELGLSGLPFHDGLQQITSQYYFLNGLVRYGEIPLWSPYVTNGIQAGGVYAMFTGGFLFKALLLVPALVKIAPFLFWHGLSLFIDRFVLLTGIWLLSGVYFSSDKVRFFVTFTAMASLVYYLQPYFSLYLFFTLPLIFYCIHRLIDTGRPAWFALGGMVFFLGNLGASVYFFPVVSFLAVFYYAVAAQKSSGGIRKALEPLWKKDAWLAWAAVLFVGGMTTALELRALDSGSSVFMTGRNASGAASLHMFLIYGGDTGLAKWNEALVGLSPVFDYALYFGILTVVLIIFGLFFSRNDYKAHVLSVIGILLLISTGTLVAIALYYVWPFMKAFRHLALLSNIVKLFACFLAGFGLEAFLESRRSDRGVSRRRILAVIGFLLTACVALVFFRMSQDGFFRQVILGSLIDKGGLPSFGAFFFDKPHFFEKGLFVLAMTAGFLALFFAREKRSVIFLLGWFLFLHASDIIYYRFDQMGKRLIVPKAVLGPALSYRDVVFKPRRETIEACFKRWGFDHEPILSRTEINSFFSSATFCDTVTLERPIYLQAGFADYLKAFFGDQGGEDKFLVYLRSLHEVTSGENKVSETFKKVSGFSEDKIRFFDEALFSGSLEREMRLISSATFHGEGLLLQGGGDPARSDQRESAWLAKDHHLDIPYQVKEFTPNRVRIRLGTPAQRPLWLFYSDAWHPRWKAFVDGKRVDVRPGNIAYKAVYLEKGAREVSFRFEDPWLVFLIRMAGVISLGVLAVILALARKQLVTVI